MTMTGRQTTEQREEEFRQHHSEHLMRQTAALESIRGILLLFMLLAVVGGMVGIALAFA